MRDDCKHDNIATSAFNGQRYCGGCGKHPHAIEMDEIRGRLDALERRFEALVDIIAVQR